MFKPQILEQINQQITQVLSNNPLTDIEKNFKAIVLSIFNKLDLVTREEFDVQQKILAKTREKLEELEQKLDSLTKIKNKEK